MMNSAHLNVTIVDGDYFIIIHQYWNMHHLPNNESFIKSS